MDGISVFDANEYRIERKRKMLPAQPLLPAANKDNTEMVKQMVEVSRFPPLFKENTLTKGLPIKVRQQLFLYEDRSIKWLKHDYNRS